MNRKFIAAVAAAIIIFTIILIICCWPKAPEAPSDTVIPTSGGRKLPTVTPAPIEPTVCDIGGGLTVTIEDGKLPVLSGSDTMPTVTKEPTPTPRPTKAPTKAPTSTPKPKQVAVDADDRELLAQVMYWENYSTGEEAMLLTGSVVLNRRDHCSWCPNTIKGVLYQKGQYSTTGKFFTKKIPARVYELADQLLESGSICPENVVFQAMFKQGSGVYKQIGTEYFCYE